MKRKLLLYAFAMLTAYGLRSQSTTTDTSEGIINPESSLYRDGHFRDTSDTRAVCFPFWMVKEIAIDLEEGSRLKAREYLLTLELETQKLLVEGLERENSNMELQLELLQKNQQLLHTQLEAGRDTKPGGKNFNWVVRMIAALGIGFILGSLN